MPQGTLLLISKTILPIFTIVGVGFLFSKVTKLKLDPLIDIIIYITTPCLVFTSMINKEFIIGEFLDIASGAFFVMLCGGFLIFLFSKIRRFDPRPFYFPIMFPNTGNMGLSVSLFAFGAVGLSKGIIYYVVTCLIFFSLGVYLLSKKSGIKTTLKIPVIYAAILGIILSIYRQPLIQFLNTHPFFLDFLRIGKGTIEMVARPTIPLMLLMLGYRLSNTKVTSFRLPLACALARIVMGLSLALIFVNLFKITGLNRAIIILISSLSSPVASFMFAQKFDARPELAASTTLISTLLMIITIPLVLAFVV